MQHAFETVRRLPQAAQDHIAETMLALADEETAGFEFALLGDAPAEEEIVALMATVLPSPVPTKAEAAAWNRLSHEEQLRRTRQALDHPDAGIISPDTMDDILAEAHRYSDERGRGELQAYPTRPQPASCYSPVHREVFRAGAGG